jgi:hypothetical protein
LVIVFVCIALVLASLSVNSRSMLLQANHPSSVSSSILVKPQQALSIFPSEPSIVGRPLDPISSTAEAVASRHSHDPLVLVNICCNLQPRHPLLLSRKASSVHRSRTAGCVCVCVCVYPNKKVKQLEPRSVDTKCTLRLIVNLLTCQRAKSDILQE